VKIVCYQQRKILFLSNKKEAKPKKKVKKKKETFYEKIDENVYFIYVIFMICDIR
jgi:hypothetical protein